MFDVNDDAKGEFRRIELLTVGPGGDAPAFSLAALAMPLAPGKCIPAQQSDQEVTGNVSDFKSKSPAERKTVSLSRHRSNLCRVPPTPLV